jgi:heme exporter protein B
MFLIFKNQFLLNYRDSSYITNAVIFFFLSIVIFSLPIASFENKESLEIISISFIWFCLLFAILLNVENIFQQDFKDGTLEQFIIHGDNLFFIILSKVISSWIIFCFPIISIIPLACLLLNISSHFIFNIIFVSILVSFLINLLTVFGASILLLPSASRSMLLLIIFPLVIPVIIFANSALLVSEFSFAIKFLFSIACFMTPILTLAVAEIIRITIRG